MKIKDLKEDLNELLDFLNKNSLKKVAVKKGDVEFVLEKEDHCSLSTTPIYQETMMEKVVPESRGFFVTSPMVGTFYSSPAPDHPSYVKIGDAVEEGSVICIIEAMKVMNEVKAGKKGIVKEILVENGHPVEFGSKLFRIE